VLNIDRYAYVNRLRGINTRLKLYFFIIMILLTLFIKHSTFHLIIFIIMSFLIVSVAKIPIKAYFKMYLLPMGFIALSIIAIIISISESDLNTIWSIKFLNIHLVIREHSLIRASVLLSRAFSALSCTYFLILTTPFNQLNKVLIKHKIPILLIELTMLTYRFIFILLEEIRGIYITQELRFGYDNLKNSYKSLGLLIRTLFFRIDKRYRDMIVSLESKGYDREFYM